MQMIMPNTEPHSPFPYASDGTENPQFDLTEWPFYWLTQAYGSYLKVVEQALKAAELDIPRWRVLMLLQGPNARSVSYLANESACKLSTMARIVQRMEEDDLVITRPRATDGRVKEVYLTKNGRRARALAWQRTNHIFSVAFKDIDPEELSQLKKTLSSVKTNLVANYESKK